MEKNNATYSEIMEMMRKVKENSHNEYRKVQNTPPLVSLLNKVRDKLFDEFDSFEEYIQDKRVVYLTDDSKKFFKKFFEMKESNTKYKWVEPYEGIGVVKLETTNEYMVYIPVSLHFLLKGYPIKTYEEICENGISSKCKKYVS